MLQQICYIRVVMINKGDVMNSISKTILLSAVSLFVDNGNLTYASEQIPLSVPKSGIQTLHTHHTHIRHTLQRLDLSSHLFDDLSSSGEEQKVASVCFITDAGNCSGQEFGNLETPDGTNRPDYDTIPEQCRDAGYTKTSCPAGQHLVNPCPSDNRYYERCECNENLTEICNIPYYGVGPSCDGKYEKCERDDDRACKEEGYPLTGSCPTLQVPNRRCPYDSYYYDKCVCQSGLISCPSPQIGVGPSCGGKYQSCQCPSSYKSCDCGPAVGASSCTINGRTTYSSCKACCDDTCPSGYSKSYPGGCYDTRTTGCGNTCYKAKECEPQCDDTCASGYSKTKPSGCYDTRTTGCGNTCYKAKECEPQCDDTCASGYSKTKPSGCYDTRTTGCGNTCYKAKECAPQCDSSYKYTCTGPHEKPGYGSCGGKYQYCNCESPYTWMIYSSSEPACECPKGPYSCTGPNEVSGNNKQCGGGYSSCNCKSGYTWNGNSCTQVGTMSYYATAFDCYKRSSKYVAEISGNQKQGKCSVCPSKSFTTYYSEDLATFSSEQECQNYIKGLSPHWYVPSSSQRNSCRADQDCGIW